MLAVVGPTEVLDNTVESGPFKAEPFPLLAGRERAKVLDCAGDSLAVQAHGDSAERLSAVLAGEAGGRSG